MRYFDPEKYALIENESILNKLAEREDRLRNKPDKDKLLEEYKDILKSNAIKYSKKSSGNYDYWFNEGYLILLETYKETPFIVPRKEMIEIINIKLRDSYRKEIKEKHILYGIDADDFIERYTQKPEFAGTEYINGILSIRLQRKRDGEIL